MLNNDLDVTLPSGIRYYNVECFLIEGQPFMLTLSKTNVFNEAVVYDPIWNASVRIMIGQDTFNLKNIIYREPTENMRFNYLSDSIVTVPSNDSLKLFIITKTGDTISATSSTTDPVHILSYHLKEYALTVYLKNDKAPLQEYYLLRAVYYLEGTPYKTQKAFDLSSVESDTLSLSLLNNDFETADSMLVKVFHISEACYAFLKSIEDAWSSNSDPFTAPTFVKSNIENGVGIFSYCTLDTVKIY